MMTYKLHIDNLVSYKQPLYQDVGNIFDKVGKLYTAIELSHNWLDLYQCTKPYCLSTGGCEHCVALWLSPWRSG